jgi:hypothetical protein
MTVSHSQAIISQAKTLGVTMDSTVVKADPISTMNITGLRHSVTGLSLRSASGSDLHNWVGSSNPPTTRLDGTA